MKILAITMAVGLSKVSLNIALSALCVCVSDFLNIPQLIQ